MEYENCSIVVAIVLFFKEDNKKVKNLLLILCITLGIIDRLQSQKKA